MIGSFLTRGLVMIFGYAYPAYECYKTVEKNKPEIEQLRFWCQYWILVALMTVCERIGDTFVSWLPMYSEAKLAFYIYLWFPKTKGTTYMYDSFFKPYVAKHETDIDRNLMELRTRAGDMAVLYCQKAVSYGHTRFFEVLQFVASQSTPAATTDQNQTQQQAPKATNQPTKASNQQAPASAMPKPQVEEPVSPTSSTSSQHQKEIKQELSSSPAPLAAAAAPIIQNAPRRLKSAPTNSTQLTKTIQKSEPDSSNHLALKKTTTEPLDTASQVAKMTEDQMQIDPIPSQQDKASSASSPQETVLEEAIQVTRARLRKARSTTK